MRNSESQRANRPVNGVERRPASSMQKQLRELTFLYETSQVLAATLDLDSMLQSLITQVRDYFQVDAVSVALLDEETGPDLAGAGELVFRIAVGEAADEVIGLRLAAGQGIAGWVLQTGEPALVAAAHDDARFYPGVDDRTDFFTRMMLAVPIKDEGRAIGVIEAINPTTGTFDEDAQRLLRAMADLAAAAIRNAELYERVRQAERRYESLFNESTDPVIVMDLEGKILNLNQRAVEVFRRSREQLLGEDPCDLFGMPRETYRDTLQQLREGKRMNLEMKIPFGEEFRTLETHVAKIDYGEREAIQWIGHDISERVELERMRDDLTHMIIHDLRNPLGNIVSSLQMMHTAFIEHDDTLPVLEVLHIAIRNSKKLSQLIDSLLDLRRLEAGKAELRKAFANPRSLVREAVELIQPLVLKKRQNLALQIAPGLPELSVDRDMMTRVLTNLLDNAIKFAPLEGHITVGVERQEDAVLFAVSNDGPDIPSEYRQRIFDRFTRLKDAEGVKGTGLGLAFCKLAVEAHGGRIWVESEAGQGSCFKFTLPLSSAPADDEA
jgi:two-component system, NtrC family, sensor histidine kinase KinB